MTFFNDAAVEAATSADSVHMAELFEIDFESGVKRFTTELVPFTDLNGNTWLPKSAQGGKDILEASGYSQVSDGMPANQTTYKISLSDEGAADLFLDALETEYRGRAITTLVQFFDEKSNPIGSPVSFPPSFMDHLSVEWDPNGGASVTMTCEGLFALRNAPRYGYVNDQDQKSNFPDDRGLERQHLARRDTHYQWPN